MARKSIFRLTHNPCSGHKLRVGKEPCTPQTHPGGSVHIRPAHLNWRQGIARHRAAEVFGVDLAPGEGAILQVKVLRRFKLDERDRF